MTRPTRAATAAGAGLIAWMAGMGLLLGPVQAAGAQADPPGNNGTVKVDELPFDDHTDNEPHVGCTFQIDFYGYDAGELSATVLFEAVPSTTDETSESQELLTDELDIGEDAASGGTDLDASATYDLSDALADIEPHEQQGWHVKLTVHAQGSQGADVKHKVFWVTSCEGPTTTTTTTTPGGTTTTVPGTTTTTKPGTTTTTAPGTSPTTSTPGSPLVEEPPTTVAGATQNESGSTTSTTEPDDGGLPETGSNTGPLVAIGVVLVTVGGVVLGALRLRQAG